jgi:hypothetical protein
MEGKAEWREELNGWKELDERRNSNDNRGHEEPGRKDECVLKMKFYSISIQNLIVFLDE